jgi:hypothetical protein
LAINLADMARRPGSDEMPDAHASHEKMI